MLIFFISNVLYGNFSCLASVWFIVRLNTENARESGSVNQQPEDHHQPLSTTINHHQPLQRMPGGDVGIWDLAVSINNQRIINEDDSGNKQKEASLIFIGETKDNQQPHFF